MTLSASAAPELVQFHSFVASGYLYAGGMRMSKLLTF